MSFTDLADASDDGDSDDNDDAAAAPPSAPAATVPAADGPVPAGYPLDGYPGWRAGVPGADNVLGVVKSPAASAEQGRAGPSAYGDADAPYAGVNDPRMMQAADKGQGDTSGALDYEKNSWRWNDPDALTYDLQRKQAQLAQAATIAAAAGPVKRGSSMVAKRAGMAAATGLLGDAYGMLKSDNPVGAASTVVGGYMAGVETPMLLNEIQAIQARLQQLRGQSST